MQSYTDPLTPDEKALILSEFVALCQKKERENNNQIISYRIAQEMINDLCVDHGFATCPCCGQRRGS